MSNLIYQVKSVEGLYNDMKQFLIGQGSSLTNFNVGSRIRTILEAIATILHQEEFDFYQGLKTAIPISVFDGFNFTKLPGINSTGKLEFTRSSPAPVTYTIPSGTGILLNGLTYETTAAGSILIGNTSSGQINAKCTTVGTGGNINANAIQTISGNGSFINLPLGVEAASNPVAFTGGKNEETDAERLTRFTIYVQSLARSTVLGILSGVKSVAGVVGVTVRENTPSEGWITIYVDDGSGALPAALKAEVEKTINGDPTDTINYPGYRPAGVQVIVTGPTVVTINVTADIKVIQGSLSTDGDLIALATSAIQNYINVLTLGYDVIKNSIAKSVLNAHSDIFDITISNPASNISIATDQLARTGTMTITATRVSP